MWRRVYSLNLIYLLSQINSHVCAWFHGNCWNYFISIKLIWKRYGSGQWCSQTHRVLSVQRKFSLNYCKNSMKSLQCYTDLWCQSRFQSKKGEDSVGLLWFKEAIVILEIKKPKQNKQKRLNICTCVFLIDLFTPCIRLKGDNAQENTVTYPYSPMQA